MRASKFDPPDPMTRVALVVCGLLCAFAYLAVMLWGGK